MTKQITGINKLTKKQKAMLPVWRDKWIKIGLKTGKTDWETFGTYMPICYKKAGLQYPKKVIQVSSPIVGALASSIANGILKKNGAVDSAVRDVVYDAVRGAVHGPVYDAVCDAVDSSVRDAVRGVVHGPVYDAVRGAVDGPVYDAVCDVVDGVVRGPVYDIVDGLVYDTVRGPVRDAVHDAVYDIVDGAVYDVVDGTKLDWHNWFGGQFWVGGHWWTSPSYISFFTDVCKLKLTPDIQERVTAYRKVCESVNYIWANSEFLMVCARPTKIERNDRGRLHSLTGKAIEYPDGWGLYVINGVRFEEDLWTKITRDQLSAKQVFEIKNTEQRRIAYELMDKSKMLKLTDYKVLDSREKDEQGNKDEVISFTVKGFDKPFIYYHCQCPTTGRRYFLQTDKETCIAAKESSFGLRDVKWLAEY